MSPTNQKQTCFSNEQIDTFVGFFDTLQTIHDRLVASGYIIKDGQIIPPQTKAGNL